MSAREAMKAYRKQWCLTPKQAAIMCNVSEALYSIVENGGVTLTSIAERIAEKFELTQLQMEELLPENRRPSSPKYDPDKYVERPAGFQNRLGETVTWIQKEDE